MMPGARRRRARRRPRRASASAWCRASGSSAATRSRAPQIEESFRTAMARSRSAPRVAPVPVRRRGPRSATSDSGASSTRPGPIRRRAHPPRARAERRGLGRAHARAEGRGGFRDVAGARADAAAVPARARSAQLFLPWSEPMRARSPTARRSSRRARRAQPGPRSRRSTTPSRCGAAREVRLRGEPGARCAARRHRLPRGAEVRAGLARAGARLRSPSARCASADSRVGLLAR